MTENLKITFRDIEIVKLHAKADKKASGDPHAVCLNRAASKLYPVANYRDLQTLLIANVKQHVTITDSLAHCSYCDFSYAPSAPGDTALHNKRHAQFEQATAEIGYMPAHYKQREESKREGYRLMHSDADLSDQVHGGLMVLRSHFDRSLQLAIIEKYWREHPIFKKYVAMAISSESHFISAPVRHEIEKQYGSYGTVDGLMESYWYPPAKPRRSA